MRINGEGSNNELSKAEMVNPKLKEFLSEEKRRVFEPGPYFTQRVMARVKDLKVQPVSAGGVWEIVPSSTRPVFALALTLLLAFVAIHIMVPIEPSTGMIEAVVDLDQSERFLYSQTAEIPTSDELLAVLEDEQQ